MNKFDDAVRWNDKPCKPSTGPDSHTKSSGFPIEDSIVGLTFVTVLKGVVFLFDRVTS